MTMKWLGAILIVIVASSACMPGRMHAQVADKVKALHVTAADGRVVAIDALMKDRPVVLVRYIGNQCLHCIRQIRLLGDAAGQLHEAGAYVVAICEDLPEENSATMMSMHLDTTVIGLYSDTAGVVADAIGARIRERDGSVTELHSTIVLNDAHVMLEHHATAPFFDIPKILAALRTKP